MVFNWEWFCSLPRAHLAMAGGIFGHHSLGRGMCCGHLVDQERPGMRLNVLQRPGQSPRQVIIWPKASVILRWRNPGLEESEKPGQLHHQSLTLGQMVASRNAWTLYPGSQVGNHGGSQLRFNTALSLTSSCVPRIQTSFVDKHTWKQARS